MVWHGGLQFQCSTVSMRTSRSCYSYQGYTSALRIVYVSENNPPGGNNSATIIRHRERDEFTWEQVILIYEVWIRSWEFETNLWGVCMAQTDSRLCCRGWRHHNLPSTPLHRRHHVQTPGPFAYSQEPLARQQYWLLMIGPDDHLEINASASTGRWNALNALLATEESCCVSVLVVRLHLYHTPGWWSAISSNKGENIYFDSSKIKPDLKLLILSLNQARLRGRVQWMCDGC